MKNYLHMSRVQLMLWKKINYIATILLYLISDWLEFNEYIARIELNHDLRIIFNKVAWNFPWKDCIACVNIKLNF